MTDWHILIDEVIAQYQLIFDGPVGDRRLSCETDRKIISCHGIDKIQLCVCCIGNHAELLDKLHWVFIQKEGKYYFYPIADKEKAFADFYYYFSQFSPKMAKLKLKLTINVIYGEDAHEKTERLLEVDLLPTPILEHRTKYLEFSEEKYDAESYEVMIEKYKFQVN